MRVKLTARLGDNQQSGLEMNRSYAIQESPDEQGRLLVFDDNTGSFHTVGWPSTRRSRISASNLDLEEVGG
jgi:hypothetical protein